MHREDNFTGACRPGSLIAGWNWDIGRLGSGVITYLSQKLIAEPVGKLEPSDYFTLDGVKVRSDLLVLPETNLYYCEKNNLILFVGDVPEFKWFQFFNQVFDLTERYIRIKQFVVIGGISAFLHHSEERELIGIYNSKEVKKSMGSPCIASEFNYETPPNQKPAINSFFLWAAWKRSIPGACIFATVPFYLMDMNDYGAQKAILKILNQKLDLKLDLSEFDRWQENLAIRIGEIQRLIPEAEYYLDRVRKYQLLDEDEQISLTRYILENIGE